jgi:heme/copper-type cytochrome/quinol oxidase subunit 2
MKARLVILGVVIVLVCALIPPLVVSSSSGGEKKEFFIKARQYAYDPPKITVNKGDEVHIRLASLDVVHGFFLEGHDIDALIEPGVRKFKLRHPSKGKEFADVDELVFTAERPGKFRYRCSHTCGTLHPFMQGELIVRPNYPFLAASGGTVGILISTLLVIFLAGEKHKDAMSEGEVQ